ncbi:hypothetical protein [Christiangramia sediminis]|uniref:Uncharacterized protein n=1 Tax=Christiangramia sediminis TaxID=2881336 RepID=A0A9X1LKM7_9FLAO|nr:hypothetical protein [Christiangramia sediminis]MCB7482126.1 hypothetical protein [Christiangramia sediminis]
MSKRVEITSQQNHNKSLLYSNKPKFKEDLRENIHKDEMPLDGILFEKIPEKKFNEVIEKIRYKARLENIKDLKLLVISILLTLFIIFLFVEKVEEELKNRQNQSTLILGQR